MLISGQDLAARVTGVLEELETGEYLLLQFAESRFVQVAVQDFVLRVESVGDQYLDQDAALTPEQAAALTTLGYQQATHAASEDDDAQEGSPNHWMDGSSPSHRSASPDCRTSEPAVRWDRSGHVLIESVVVRPGDRHQRAAPIFGCVSRPEASQQPLPQPQAPPARHGRAVTHIPPPLGHLGMDLPYDTLIPRVTEWLDFTPLANAAGTPSISLPLGHDAETILPIGIMFGADFGQERMLLELALQVEEAQPWGSIQP